jgi:hypothetical protein
MATIPKRNKKAVRKDSIERGERGVEQQIKDLNSNRAIKKIEDKLKTRVEKLNPEYLVPDPTNPRPGWSIDDEWLERHLKLSNEKESLIKMEFETEDGTKMPDGYIKHIPTCDELALENPIERRQWDSVRNTALSMQDEGQIEKITYYNRNGEYTILVGHIRRLSALILRWKSIDGVEDKEISELFNTHKDSNGEALATVRKKQLAENIKRSKYSENDILHLVSDSYSKNPKLTQEQLGKQFNISKGYMTIVMKLVKAKTESNLKIHEKLIQFCFRLDVSYTFSELAKVLKMDKQRQSNWVNSKLGIQINRKITADKKDVSVKFDLKNIEKIGSLLLERIPELGEIAGLSEVSSDKDIKNLVKALSKMVS